MNTFTKIAKTFAVVALTFSLSACVGETSKQSSADTPKKAENTVEEKIGLSKKVSSEDSEITEEVSINEPYVVDMADNKDITDSVVSQKTEDTKTEDIISEAVNEVEETTESVPTEDNAVGSSSPQNVLITEDGVKYNFDELFGFAWEGQQQSIDAGYVTYYFGDFYHHNTDDFVNVLYSLNPGDKIIIAGTTYTFDHLERGHVKYVDAIRGYIYAESNAVNSVYYDGITQIITCADDSYWDRTIAFLY